MTVYKETLIKYSSPEAAACLKSRGCFNYSASSSDWVTLFKGLNLSLRALGGLAGWKDRAPGPVSELGVKHWLPGSLL